MFPALAFDIEMSTTFALSISISIFMAVIPYDSLATGELVLAGDRRILFADTSDSSNDWELTLRDGSGLVTDNAR